MGGRFGIFRNSVGKIGPIDLSVREYGMLKKLWLEVETNPRKYGRGVCMRFFTQYPQYVKYFTETASPPRDAFHRVDNTFVTMLSTIGFLILDFYINPKKFDNALDYVAILHQEMHLKVEDLHNFSYSMILYLKDAMPEVMTEECAKVFAEFMDDVSHQLMAKMVRGRMEFSRDMEEQNCIYNPCRWLNPRGRMIFGHERSYWITRRNRWEMKMQRWKSGETPAKPNVLFDLLKGSPTTATSNHRSNGGSSLNADHQPRAEGSVMSEILQDKLRRETQDEAPYRSGTLHSGSSQNFNVIGRYSTAAAIVLGGVEVPQFTPQLTPRERFRNRNRAIDPPPQKDENAVTIIEARKKRRESFEPDKNY